ncbi:MAG: hypothetical protein KatS3mg031_1128 [Chitinophagales bacterium]|nr:MAG: hypothetical protein KatS3mg031_1128 [Chitinophagales bacterium]
MEKVLIMSYFFPPCNLTASSRVAGWARYLPDFGYEPIVVTRNWDVPVSVLADMARDSGTQDELKTIGQAKVWYTQHRGNLRDRILAKYGDKRFNFLRRGLTFLELILENFMVSHLSYANLYYKAREILAQDASIRKIIISASPYAQFHFGYLLKKEFPRIQWLADYRDDWTTTELAENRHFPWSFIYLLNRRSEKKWLSSSAAFLATAEMGKKRIEQFVGKKGYVVLNGFDNHIQLSEPIMDRKRFIITYTGTLYKTQPVELLLDAFKILHDQFRNQIEVILQFPGLAFNREVAKRIEQYLKNYSHAVKITPRIPREEVMDLQQKSNLLVLIGHTGLKGIAPSKMFEYIGMRKKILFCCNDHDIIENALTQTGLGIICDSVDEIVQSVSKEIHRFLQNPESKPQGNEQAIQQFSRKVQVQKLAEILDTLK